MKKCLLVDDSRVVRKVSRKIMEPLGFDVDDAEDGQVALDYCTNQPMPEVILLDWNMPVMNGIDFLRALRELPEGSTPKVIFCTTENDLQHIQEAMQAGADEYIMKPFDEEIVKNKLQQLDIISADTT
jgi:two-component system chemotaxis response regulator CheY